MILHTGDMRWQPHLAEHPALRACKVELLYMDTTYCLPKHVFPSQVILGEGNMTNMQAYTAVVFVRQTLQSWVCLTSRQTGRSCAAVLPGMCSTCMLQHSLMHSLADWTGVMFETTICLTCSHALNCFSTVDQLVPCCRTVP